MRKKIFLLPICVIIIDSFSGCLTEEDNQSETSAGEISDFYGTWTERTGKGSFSMGNSIRFKDDKTCDFFWENSTIVLASGKWEITVNSSDEYILTIKIGVSTYHINKNGVCKKMQKLRLAVYVSPQNYVYLAKLMQENKLKNEGVAINFCLKEYFEQQGRLQRMNKLLEAKLQDANTQLEMIKRGD